MFSAAYDWNPNQKNLAYFLLRSDTYKDAISLCLEMHKQLHDLSKYGNPTIYQQLIFNLNPRVITFRAANHFSSIAWNIWHITRIEDAISNILINKSNQILNSEWNKKLGVKTTETGNSFSEIDVDNFDLKINTSELMKYRKAVGKNTQKILKKLTTEDRVRKPQAEQFERILKEGVLTNQKESIWLLDFWRRKSISGLLTMPITRHQIVHINDCIRLKEKYSKQFN